MSMFKNKTLKTYSMPISLSMSICFNVALNLQCQFADPYFAVTSCVQQNVGRLLITMDDISGMKIACGRQQLVHDEPLVDVLQNAWSPGTKNSHLIIQIF